MKESGVQGCCWKHDSLFLDAGGVYITIGWRLAVSTGGVFWLVLKN